MTTLEQIAQQAGVSTITVSRVLTGKGKGVRTSAVQRAQRIRDIARQLGYRPNVAARAVSTGRFGSITMVTRIDSRRILLPEPLLRGIDDVLCEHDMHMSLARVSGSKLTSEDELPKLVREFASDGLLMNYVAADVSPIVREILDLSRIPCVWLNTKSERDAVYPDDLSAGRQACEYLLSLGHKRIAYVSYNRSGHYSEVDRQAGYQNAMHDAGLPEQVCNVSIDYRNQLHDDRLTVSRGLLASPSRPTAVITYSPEHALPLYEAARDLGLKVPADFSILTFNPEYRVNDLGIAFTTMATPELKQGEAAVKMLLRKINRANQPLPSQPLQSTLLEGLTCAAPSA